MALISVLSSQGAEKPPNREMRLSAIAMVDAIITRLSAVIRAEFNKSFTNVRENLGT
jgi:hypothetical protein